jgi:hypothetical protein
LKISLWNESTKRIFWKHEGFVIHDTKRIRICQSRNETNLLKSGFVIHDTVRIHGFAKRIHVFTNLLYESRNLKKYYCKTYCFNWIQLIVFQDSMVSLVLRVLMSVKQNQVESIVSQLDTDQLDLLMKFVYRGFESPSDGSSGNNKYNLSCF